LVEAAAREFNAHGYHGTDSNRIARAAGYAPGTFYNHFVDKADVFVAAYESWVAHEWKMIDEELGEKSLDALNARRIVESLLEFHERWATFRASLHAVVPVEERARDAYRKNRRRQLDRIAKMRGERAGSPEADAILLYAFERTFDALANGEGVALDLSRERILARLARMLLDHFGIPHDASPAARRAARS
jgi:AcrR family transcriptional regulator